MKATFSYSPRQFENPAASRENKVASEILIFRKKS